MNDHMQERLETAFPALTDANVIRGVREGALLADDVISNEPLLRTLVGLDLRGHIRRAGVLFRLHDLCVNGDLPFSASMEEMPRGNWHWLEMRSGSVKAHVCRTEGPLAFPDDTPSRQDERCVNQLDLFSDNVISFRTLAAEITEFYAWLMFGVSREGELGHLCWGMPPAGKGDWLAHINVLKRTMTAKTLPAEPGPAEQPTRRLRLRFREHIEDALNKEVADKDDNDRPS